jgi:hypothetical protein
MEPPWLRRVELPVHIVNLVLFVELEYAVSSRICGKLR